MDNLTSHRSELGEMKIIANSCKYRNGRSQIKSNIEKSAASNNSYLRICVNHLIVAEID